MKRLIFLVVAILALAANANANNLSDLLKNDPKFSLLNHAVQTAGLAEAVATLSDATVFAPTNASFESLTVSEYNGLMSNPDLLKKLLLNHIVPEALSEAAIGASRTGFKTLAGYTVIGVTILQGGTNDFLFVELGTDCESKGSLSIFERAGAPEITTPDIRLDNNVIVQVLDTVQTRTGGPNPHGAKSVQLVGNGCIINN